MSIGGVNVFFVQVAHPFLKVIVVAFNTTGAPITIVTPKMVLSASWKSEFRRRRPRRSLLLFAA